VSRCVFYVPVIGGRQCEGILSGNGPYITCGHDGVALGTCTSIDQFASDNEHGAHRRRVSPNSWWVTKYHTQPRISLDGMNDTERRQLAEEFGIRVGREGPNNEQFWDSPAFHALVAWMKKERSTAASFRDASAYLPGWYAAARAAAANEL
jgi:hypothetical protein